MLQKCSHVFADIITIVVTIYYSYHDWVTLPNYVTMLLWLCV